MSKPSGFKLKLTSSRPSISSPVTTPTSGGPKIKFSIGSSSKPTTPVEAPKKPTLPPPPPPPEIPVQKTKAGRARKPSAKVIAANANGKRHIEESSEDEEPDVPLAQVERPAKKQRIKLSVGGPKTPLILKPKFKGKPPKRPPGEGYDSEASDREIDPVIEEEFILRMMPGDDCEYLRRMIEERKVGLPRREGGADVQMKFFDKDGRRAMVTIRGTIYAATLVDLPTIVEGMKSWDKRGWWKSADICQMLYVFAKVRNETEAHTIELPKTVDSKTYQFPHGLTPPMHYARKRRFRKRISRTAIEAVEAEVERLLEADASAVSTRYEIFDPDAGSRHTSMAYSPGASSPGGYDMLPNGQEQYSDDEDAEGEEIDEGYFNQNSMADLDTDMNDLLEAEMTAALEAEESGLAEGVTPASEGITPGLFANGETPAGAEEPEFDSGDESFESGADDAGGVADVDGIDEDERVRQAQLNDAREEIVELEQQVANLQTQLSQQANPILKTRIKSNIEKIKAELVLKKSAIGDAEED
jgi:transcription initiation factor TFIID subunit 7